MSSTVRKSRYIFMRLGYFSLLTAISSYSLMFYGWLKRPCCLSAEKQATSSVPASADDLDATSAILIDASTMLVTCWSVSLMMKRANFFANLRFSWGTMMPNFQMASIVLCRRQLKTPSLLISASSFLLQKMPYFETWSNWLSFSNPKSLKGSTLSNLSISFPSMRLCMIWSSSLTNIMLFVSKSFRILSISSSIKAVPSFALYLLLKQCSFARAARRWLMLTSREKEAYTFNMIC